MELSNKMIQDLVNRRHPDYELRKAHWDFIAATAGGRTWFKDNIFRYFKEGDASSRSVWNALTGLTIPAKS
jgi:hypothetical protein